MTIQRFTYRGAGVSRLRIRLWASLALAVLLFTTNARAQITFWSGSFWFPRQIVSQSQGRIADRDSGPASVSSDGRFVAFESDATNLISGIGNETLVYLRDTCAGSTAPPGCQPSTTLVSVTSGTTLCFGAPQRPSISVNGRYVAFESNTCTLPVVNGGTPTNTRFWQIYLRDTCAGVSACEPSTAQITNAIVPGGTTLALGSRFPSISSDGKYIAFVSNANMFSTANYPANDYQIFVADVSQCEQASQLSTSCIPKIKLVSQNAQAQPAGDKGCGSSTPCLGAVCTGNYMFTGGLCNPQISGNGRFATFVSKNTDLGANGSNMQLFVADSCQAGGSSVPTCNVQAYGPFSTVGPVQANADVLSPSVDTTGRFLAFASTATNLVLPNPTHSQVYFVDDCSLPTPIAGCTPPVLIVSTPDGTTAGNGDSDQPIIDAAADSIFFRSAASNLPTFTSGTTTDIYQASTCAPATSPCTRAVFTGLLRGRLGQVNGASWPTPSADLSSLVFTSNATNIGLTSNTAGTQLVYSSGSVPGILRAPPWFIPPRIIIPLILVLLVVVVVIVYRFRRTRVQETVSK